MTTPPDLLDAARTDPTTRLVLADCIRDDSGGIDTPAVLAVARMWCESCACPDTRESVCWDLEGRWHYSDDVMACSIEHWCLLFGATDDPRHEPGTLTLYRTSDRWHLVCPHCKRGLVAQRAAATRRANKLATVDAAPNLFSNAED
jgi:hypothetical protein